MPIFIMDSSEIIKYRLANQQIANSKYKDPGEIVSFMGALQAQDYPASLWAIGLRLRDSTRRDVENAIESKSIVRTWPMRQTLHFVSHADVRWMLKLYREQIIPNYQKKNGLTEEILEKGERMIIEAFDGKRKLTSKEIYAKMNQSDLPVLRIREVQQHILRRAGRDGIVCYASHEGKQATFALLDEWVGRKERLSKEESLAKLASRYFTSHGPATLKDFVWWSGLLVSEARMGIEKAMPGLRKEEIEGKTYYLGRKPPRPINDATAHLLPAFDEYLVSYSDRSAVLSEPRTQKMLKSGKIFFAHSNGIFLPTIVVNGQVVGTWKRSHKPGRMELTLNPFIRLDKEAIKGVKEAAERYGSFLETEVALR
jgi:hypothetical protein